MDKLYLSLSVKYHQHIGLPACSTLGEYGTKRKLTFESLKQSKLITAISFQHGFLLVLLSFSVYLRLKPSKKTYPLSYSIDFRPQKDKHQGENSGIHNTSQNILQATLMVGPYI